MRVPGTLSTLLAIAGGLSAIVAPLVLGAPLETGLAAGAAVTLFACAGRLATGIRSGAPLARALLAVSMAVFGLASIVPVLPGAPATVTTALLLAGSVCAAPGLGLWLSRERLRSEELDALRILSARREGDVREQAERIRRLDLFDPASGLYNRRAFSHTAGAALEDCAKTGQPVALLLVDLDPPGDAAALCEVLRRAGAALQRAVRGSDLAGRWDRTQLALMLPGCREVEPAVRRLADSLRALGESAAATRLAGVAVGCRGPWPDIDGLMASAQAALTAARRGPTLAAAAIWPIDWGLAAARSSETGPQP